MTDKGVFDVTWLQDHKHEFMLNLKELGHAVITQDSQPIAFMHRVNSTAQAMELAAQAYETGISPKPYGPPLTAHSVDRYWDDLLRNITSMTTHPRSITVLTFEGRVVAVVQSLVPNLATVVAAKDPMSTAVPEQQVYPPDDVSVEELVEELGVNETLADLDR